MPRRRFLAIAACAFAASAPPVPAHGPCACLTPASGGPGTTVSVSTGAYKVVFNPDRTDLGIGPERLWRAHRSEVAPAEVFRSAYEGSDAPLRGPVEFRVPAAPPGRYLVAIYDGTEGGAHYTWDHLRVERGGTPTAGPARPSAAASQAGGVPGLAVAIVGLAALLAGLAVGWLTRARRTRQGRAAPSARRE